MTDKHLMIDIETLGIRPQAPVIQLAAVEFDLESHLSLGVFTIRNNPTYIENCERETLLWWLNTNPTMLAAILSEENTLTLGETMQSLSTYVAENKIKGVWAWGDLDFKCLRAQVATGFIHDIYICHDLCEVVMQNSGKSRAMLRQEKTDVFNDEGWEAHNPEADCMVQIEMFRRYQ